MMKLLKTTAWMISIALSFSVPTHAQQVNDSNTPLHLMQPQYLLPYGVSTPQAVKQKMDQVLHYLEQATPCVLEDKNSGKEVSPKDIDPNTQLRRGDFRLTSYEWGVTYSAMLAAADATGDEAYRNYALRRMTLLANSAPAYAKMHQKNIEIDPLMRKVVDPHALDDAGAICSAMIKALSANPNLPYRSCIDHYADYIINKEYRLADGTFARLRPHKNTVWLDDMFMGIPSLAQMGRLTGEQRYYDAAVQQIMQFRNRMFVEEKGLFRHGWVEAMQPHPAFHWGRANGWAILTMCEVLDVLPKNHAKRTEILELLRAHIAGLARLQQKDGYWHQLLDRNDTYRETSCTAIFTYCIAHAINQGWIDALAYGPVAQLGWNAVEHSINEKGQVENVCVGTGMGFDPAFYAYRPVHVMAAHGYGPALWAGAEMIRLLKEQHPKMNDSAVQFYPEEVPTNQPIFNYDGKIRY
ncbi:MAG: glycoside hydrolase family 88 protein [Prevotella sp.]|nr:glycoside hydrolase family 88 protein [Prevotella sp.]